MNEISAAALRAAEGIRQYESDTRENIDVDEMAVIIDAAIREETESLRAENQRLREALNRVLPYVRDSIHSEHQDRAVQAADAALAQERTR